MNIAVLADYQRAAGLRAGYHRPVQTITPYLLYEDAAGALDFLSRLRIRGDDADQNAGRSRRARRDEVRRRPGASRAPGRPSSPRSYGGTPVLLYVYVGDVDEQCARARAAGAVIVDEPADQAYGDRRYHCRDQEGHSWYFAQRPPG